MQYDFDQVIDRSGNFSAKYDERRKKFGTDDVIPLWVADMDFAVAQPIMDAMGARLAQGIFGYTSRPDSYFEAVSLWQQKRHGWSPDAGLMAFSPGVVPTLSALVELYSKPGDPILIQPPVYPEFASAITKRGRRPLEAPLKVEDGRYTADLEAFEAALAQRPALFILCSPHNPVGRVWTREELGAMCGLCAAHGVRVVSDEIHSDLLLWGNRHIPTATLSPETAGQVITCLSGTKTFNLAGLQASTTVFPNREELERFNEFWRRLDISRNNCFSLVAMEAAFRGGDEWLDQLLPYLEENMQFVRDYCAAYIPQVRPNLPEATYLMWLDCRGLGLPDGELAEFMVRRAGLGLNPGVSFGSGGEGFMRLNAACPRSVLERALGQLRAAADAR